MGHSKPVADSGISVIIGAGSAIASTTLSRLLAQPGQRLLAVSRSARPESLRDARLEWLQSDYSDDSIAECAEHIAARVGGSIDRLLICHGILHDDGLQPEKRIEDIDRARLLRVIETNAVLPALWLKALLPALKGKSPCRVAVFSARVGSIGDNRLGGWYAYRASKSALNMLLKSAAIEYARRAGNVKLIAFHPGTTDTPLSQPFQASVPQGKLFSPDFVAERLLAILDDSPIDGELSYLDWQGETIPY
jgi:NAD(P)-dependent dehydrogenase (short-subunit alcohol dehydrogenase family)